MPGTGSLDGGYSLDAAAGIGTVALVVDQFAARDEPIPIKVRVEAILELTGITALVAWCMEVAAAN